MATSQTSTIPYHTIQLKHMMDVSLGCQVRLTGAIADVVQDFGLVFFIPLNIMEDSSKRNVVKNADKACGYLFDDKLDEDETAKTE